MQTARRRCTGPLRADDVGHGPALLLKAGANANAANRYGMTPLSLAAINGNAAMLEALLAAGADANEHGVARPDAC